jgi:hypothetical protein
MNYGSWDAGERRARARRPKNFGCGKRRRIRRVATNWPDELIPIPICVPCSARASATRAARTGPRASSRRGSGWYRSSDRASVPRSRLWQAAEATERLPPHQRCQAQRPGRWTDDRSGDRSARSACCGWPADRARLGAVPGLSGFVAGTADRCWSCGLSARSTAPGQWAGDPVCLDDEPPDLAWYPAAGVLSSRAEALRSALADAGARISTLSHWSKPETAQLDLTVVACDRPEPDRVITDHLVRNDQPHLLLRCWGNGVNVGPLVVSGQTSCVRCADLSRSDADPQWPAVLRQLSRLQIDTPPALLAWAASVAAAQTLAFLHGELPESAGSTVELSWPDLVTRLRHWPAHPSCGCGWLSHTEWGP